MGLGPYPGSMVGLSTDEFSNMDPPTLAIVALIFWQAGAAMVLRHRVSAWLRRVRVWAGVIYINSVIMTLFLWQLAVMLLGIGILYPLGWPQPEAGTASWWALRPVWILALVVILGGFVAGLGRFEQRGFGRTAPVGATGSASAAALAATLLVWGVLGFALGGMHQLFSVTGTELLVFQLNPFQNILHLALGGIVLWGAVRPRTSARPALLGAGLALAVLTVLGLAWVGDPEVNRLAANGADNVLHAVLAAVALLLAAAPGRRSVDVAYA
jgi:hypothetical protein